MDERELFARIAKGGLIMNVVIPKNVWLSSQLSIARYYGGCTVDGHQYTVVAGSEDLVRNDWLPVYRKAGPKKTLELASRGLKPKEAIKECTARRGSAASEKQLSIFNDEQQ